MIHKPTTLVKVNPIEVHKVYDLKVNSCLFQPSRIDGYSLCVEFMTQWFLNKFVKNFWKAVNVDGHDPFNEMAQWTIKDWVKRQKPALSIIPNIDLTYNRDHIDDDFGDLSYYLNRTNNANTFFRDTDNNVYLGLTSRLNVVTFEYKMKFGQLAQQMDAYDYINAQCRVGKTLTLYPSVDFVVPSNLVHRLATDLDFELDEKGFLKEPIKFLEYMNSHSTLTFLYKLRGTNRRMEFFVRIPDIMVNVRDITLDADKGEREGMTMTNFMISMNLQVRMPCPKFFVYFSYAEFEQVVYKDEDGESVATDLVLTKILPTNDNGWNILLEGDFTVDKEDEKINISLYDMFKSGDGGNNDILEAIEYCRDRMISPEVFMEIKVFNDMKEQDIYVDWGRMVVSSRKEFANKVSHVVVYTDLAFINNAVTVRRKYNQKRIG